MAQNTDPNAQLKAFLAEHEVTPAGVCSCGWDLASYDIAADDWEDSDAPARDRAWVAHLERIWMAAHGLADIQAATTVGPNGQELAFTMEPGHDTLSQASRGLDAAREYHGAYRFADYEPPPPSPDTVPSKHLTCEEAGCRDPHCLGGHYSYSLSIPLAEKCAGCRKPFADDEERTMVMLKMPDGIALEDGVPVSSAATYHKDCEPSDEELQKHAEKLWPSQRRTHRRFS